MKYEVPAPLLNPNEPSATLTKWHVDSGAPVKRGEMLCDLTTSKITFEVVAEHEGFVLPLLRKGRSVKAGDPVAQIFTTTDELAQAQKEYLGPDDKKAATTFSREARQLMQNLKLNEDMFHDLEFVTARQVIERQTGPEDLAQSEFKKAEAKALTSGAREALRSSLTIRVIFHKDPPEFGEPYGAPAFWAYHLSQVLGQKPRFMNFFLEPAPQGQSVDIGYAVDPGDGPRQFLAASANTWTQEQWRERLAEWTLASARKQIQASDLGMGRFSLTDLSSFEVYQFEPLLVGRQSAILGVGGDRQNGRHEFTLTLAFDHRVHNGLEAAEFLRALRQRVII